MEMIALARSATDLPFRLTMPYSVTTIHHIGTRSGDDVAGRQVEDDPAAALARFLVGGSQQMNDFPPFDA